MSFQHLLEHFGVSVGAISGVLAARGKHVDLFGVIVLAMVTAFGGGTVRDLSLGAAPVFWVADPTFLYNAVITALITFFAERFYTFPRTVLLVADAFVLAFFTMAGARKAETMGCGPAIAITMGVITGVAGGMLRDVLTGQIPLVFRRHIYLYATAALCGALVFEGMNRFWSGHAQASMITGIVVVLGLRLAAIRWRLSLPEFESCADCPDESPPGAPPKAPPS